jgi:Holliday junction resolvasome RuvABC endonuclease subunit
MTVNTPTRIVAINPGMEHVGIAVVVEGENQLWYGIKTFQAKTISEVRLTIQQHLAALVEKYAP